MSENDGENPTIEVRGLDVSLGGRTVLSDVNLCVERGQFVGLIGPNGAGKSTLLRTMSGYLSPDEGSVRIGSEDVNALSSRAASRLVATVPQEWSLSFSFPVRDVVAMGRTPHRGRIEPPRGADEEAVDRALSRTNVESMAGRPIDELSGGEKQRVILARALSQETPVLLLDEPTASLDINHQIRTLELVSELVRDGKTIVAAIHDLNLAAHYCDELVLLSAGTVLSSGPPETVLTEERLRSAFETRAVVARHPVTGSVYVTALPDAPTGDRGRVHVIGGGGTASRLLYVLSAAGFDVSAGALNEGDTDLETARLLGLDAVTVPPFASIDDTTLASVERRVEASDVTVLADVEVGAGNLPNLDAAAKGAGIVIVEERSFEERNYAGPEARSVYEDLCERGRIVTADDALSAVIAAVEESE